MPVSISKVPKRDQEARDLRLHHQIAVEEPDGQREDQRQRRTCPQVQVQVVGQHRCGERTRGHRHAGRQVEFAADHQQRDRARHDADRRAGVQHGRQRFGRPERRRDDQEEDEDRDRADHRTHLGANQHALYTVSFLDAFVVNDLVTGDVQISLCRHVSLSPAGLTGSGLGQLGDGVDVRLVDERRARQRRLARRRSGSCC